MKRLTAVLSTISASVMILSVACGDVSLVADDDGPHAIEVGNMAFSAEMYDTAMNAYTIAQESMPERSEPMYNTANTLYRQQRFREAIELYDQILASSDLHLSERTTFNAGNALYEAGDPEQAIEMYKKALRNNPDDLDAKHNLELAWAHLPQPPQSAQEAQEEQPTEEAQSQQPPGQPGDGSPQEGEGDEPIEGEGDEPQQGEGDEPIEGEGDEPQPDDEGASGVPGPDSTEWPIDSTEWPIIPHTGLTEEQARRLLEMVGENAEPLRNAIQFRRPSDPQTAQEW